LTCVPLHASTAPTAGTRQSFLWGLVASVGLGGAMPAIACGPDLTGVAKRGDGQVNSGVTMLRIDNENNPLSGDEVVPAIERPSYIPRILGQSKMKERRNNWALFATGNNLRLRDDVTRRALLSRLDAGMERPELRPFKSNPLERVLADRGLYLWACLTVVR